MKDVTNLAPPVVPTSETNIQLVAALAVATVPPAAAAPPVATQQPAHKLRVLIESPFAAPAESAVGLNQLYGRAALRDSLLRGEAPMASHLLYAQTFVLDGEDPAEREIGTLAGFSWLPSVDRLVVYTDRGINADMRESIRRAEALGVPVEERSIPIWARG